MACTNPFFIVFSTHLLPASFIQSNLSISLSPHSAPLSHGSLFCLSADLDLVPGAPAEKPVLSTLFSLHQSQQAAIEREEDSWLNFDVG